MKNQKTNRKGEMTPARSDDESMAPEKERHHRQEVSGDARRGTMREEERLLATRNYA
ncbi:MAG: hypothetical protein M3Z08_20330 [Chloroflexota bacterium]|nr:hypothetical protein [Chloroflexota bacterium]